MKDLNKLQFFEVMERCNAIQTMIDSLLTSHQAITDSPRQVKRIKAAQAELSAVYSDAADVFHALIEPYKHKSNNELIKGLLDCGRRVISAAVGRAGNIVSVSDDFKSVFVKVKGIKIPCSTTFDHGDKVVIVDCGDHIKIINAGDAVAY